ncbi:WD repeat-containing protein 89 isoform X1 [Bemisia tabaci]|uniref:WD repeat-containing protein 89 isoform X1 n=1 Tax=Bemisia tabaci TaxID=7038 RepID=UPI003B286529
MLQIDSLNSKLTQIHLQNTGLSGTESENDSVCETASLTTFPESYALKNEEAASLKQNYILHMSVARENSEAKVALSTSNHSCIVYQVGEQIAQLTSLNDHDKAVSNVRISSQNTNLVFSGSLDGTIKLWDLRRSSKCVKTFQDDTRGDDKLKPITSFDINCDNRVLCAGTELVDGDAFLLFWDIRTTNLLGGYWESHTDDVTQICFHPSQTNVLVSGSSDGLINVFDINETNESAALQNCLNTQSCVEKLSWIKSREGEELDISCITSTVDLQLWSLEGASPYLAIDRDTIGKGMSNSSDDCYLVDVHQFSFTQDLMLLGGCTLGNGDNLQSLKLSHDSKIKPMANFVGNKQIVRCSWHNPDTGVLLTAGEASILSVWKPSVTEDLKSTVKPMKKERKRKPTPY